MEFLVDFFNQYSRRLATIASVVLVLLMSLSVASTVLFFVRSMNDAKVGPATHNDARTDTAGGDHINISELNLFGSVSGGPANVDAPETNLNLELQGVFTAANPKDSTAIVAESGQDGKLYRINDKLPGNAVLKAVFDNHILIQRGGRLEKLMFPNTESTNGFSSAGQASGNLGFSRQSINGTTNETSSDRLRQMRERIEARRQQLVQDAARESNLSPGASIRDYVERFHKQIESDPQAVLNQLGVSPVASGEASGYRIGSNVPAQMLAQAGLQQGDVILSVNGRPVGDVSSDSSFVNQVMAAGRARVEVQRGSRKFFLTVPIPRSR